MDEHLTVRIPPDLGRALRAAAPIPTIGETPSIRQRSNPTSASC